MKKKSIRIKELAEALGLSQGTISIVLNGRGDEMQMCIRDRVYTLRKTDSLKGYREEEGFKVYRQLRRLLQQVYMCCRAECIAEKLYK